MTSLGNSRLKIKRAKQDFEDLKRLIATFMKNRPFRARVDEETGTVFARVKRDPPDEWGILVGDIIHRLRTAFDYVAWQLVIVNGGNPDHATEFPVTFPGSRLGLEDIPTRYETLVSRKVDGMSDRAKTLIKSLQPWQDGQRWAAHPLYVLSRLDNQDKHRALHVVGGAISNPKLGASGAGTVYFDYEATNAAMRIVPIKDGTVLARHSVKDGQDMKVNYEFSFDIAFDESTMAAERRSVVQTLHQLIDFTSQAIDLFDGELFR